MGPQVFPSDNWISIDNADINKQESNLHKFVSTQKDHTLSEKCIMFFANLFDSFLQYDKNKFDWRGKC
jgi:hypothetical protein